MKVRSIVDVGIEVSLILRAHLPQPDSQKSMTEQMGDSMKGTADSIASSMQPQVSHIRIVACPTTNS